MEDLIPQYRQKLLGLTLTLAVIIGLFHYQLKKPVSPMDLGQIQSTFKQAKQWIGKEAPLFQFTLLNGEKFNLSDYRGRKVVILNFFTTWCGPCKIEMPELSKYYENNKDNRILIVGVDGNEDKNLVQKFVDQYNVQFPVGIDQDRSIQNAYAVTAYPTNVVIGPDGKILYYQAGPILNAEMTIGPTINMHIKNYKFFPEVDPS